MTDRRPEIHWVPGAVGGADLFVAWGSDLRLFKVGLTTRAVDPNSLIRSRSSCLSQEGSEFS